MAKTAAKEPYRGFEQGPIRPPSEALSLLVRVTRNCPWNRCTFCPVYKREKFSIRPVEHVKQDIDAVYEHVQALASLPADQGSPCRDDLQRLTGGLPDDQWPAFQAACHWYVAGRMKSVFLQDANSLAMRPADLLEILEHIKQRFPHVERVTTYARSPSIARLQPDDLAAFRRAGLNRIHVGLESGADEILARVQKGTTKQVHVEAGRMVKTAGIELSEYYMPGLGGRELSRLNARESADALNRIDPDFIRLRSLAVAPGTLLSEEQRSGAFVRCTDVETAEEILLFLESLDGITSVVASDHILNLLQDVCGRLPEDKERMLGIVREFLNLTPDEQVIYQVGRRMGLLTRLSDLDDRERRRLIEHNCRRLGITSRNSDAVLERLMQGFV